MTHTFDKDYWEHHWDDRTSHTVAANPYLVEETAGSTPGTALDAGCGAGAEAIWLAERGWRVTGADISAAALTTAAQQAQHAGVDVTWIEADLTSWDPAEQWDLVMTHYAHPSIPQLEFYRHIAQWVAPGGSLLIVGHLHDGAQHDSHEGTPPHEATVTAKDITALFDASSWRIDTATERSRTVGGTGLHSKTLRDAVVRVTRVAPAGTKPAPR
ncbi:methyltransferase domain-containing protein [Rhodococcus sp. ARC_M12]|uniref:class I SAM-dependent methyltransferase n=1 Tax=unclassified Rhodococcus (in: high G+C Gram-positive bacteria) TaxID=192944 RepID=UPI001FB410BD|nr:MULTISPECIES: class I SAM-dependent methyltransferase [unclassified Rhodococcus (in: high G+C Gram-positive bacteria)]MCJ0892062.1 methyltransferase domain-containing protein [Rhodococcus sp. ARC_M5]MCJ0980813.1 methyltransferase domain-containing protein [Rhodococcus sp. ARC_M12]